jgi:hypothetical protein
VAALIAVSAVASNAAMAKIPSQAVLLIGAVGCFCHTMRSSNTAAAGKRESSVVSIAPRLTAAFWPITAVAAYPIDDTADAANTSGSCPGSTSE